MTNRIYFSMTNKTIQSINKKLVLTNHKWLKSFMSVHSTNTTITTDSSSKAIASIFIFAALMLTTMVLTLSIPFNTAYAAASNDNSSASINTKQFDHSHQTLTAVLKANLKTQGSASRVNYAQLQKNATLLRTYIGDIEALTEKQFKQFSRSQQLAFLLNYYNAHQLQQVIDNYPIKSVKDLGFLLYTPWKIKFFTIFGEPAHLDYIGHDLLKPYQEPRIHFALNCASIGCPALHKEAYQADKLEQQLDGAARAFLSDKNMNHYDAKKHQLRLSPIFKWYEKDFGGKDKLYQFLAKHMPGYPSNSQPADIKYGDYDWNLNDINAGF